MALGNITPKIPKETIGFLEINGLKKVDNNTYANNLCKVIVDMEKRVFQVVDEEGWTMYIRDLNMYWLIGLLTYNAFIDQNYKIVGK